MMSVHHSRIREFAAGAETPRRPYLSRREFIAAMAAGTVGATGPSFAGGLAAAATANAATVPQGAGPFLEYGADRPLALERAGRAAPPPTLHIGGLVRREMRVDLDQLLKRFPPQDRTCRFRCVEGWARVVPWVGFALRELVEWCNPSSSARYVRFIAAYDPPTMPGIPQQPWHRWPYTEALTIDEAVNELTFLATGVFGRPLQSADGAPLRLVVPWKYGHKSIKALARIEFVAQRPATFWNSALPHEYPFEANVDPHVPHPRWSQEFETIIGTGQRVKTQPFNGYAEFVAGLYR